MNLRNTFAIPGCLLLIALCACLSYLSSFQGIFLLDDLPHIVESSEIRKLRPISSHLLSGGLRRLPALSFALNYELGGLRPFGYHIFNLAVHTLAGFSLFGLTYVTLLQGKGKLESNPWQLGASLAVALIWVVHPLNTQAVTYIVQRSESMMGLAFFSMLLLYALSHRSHQPKRLLVLCFLIYSAGLLCKEVMVMALPAVMLYDRAFFSESWKEGWRKRGWFWIVCAMPLLAATMLIMPALLGEGDAAVGFQQKDLSWLQYLRTQPEVFLHYLRLAVIPYRQCFDYGWPVESRWLVIGGTTAIIAGGLIYSFIRFAKNPQIHFWILASFLVLLPTTLVPLQDIAVEHRMYVPLGFLLIPSITYLATMFYAQATPRKWLAVGLLAVMTLTFGFLTFERNKVYGSAIAMWTDVIDYAQQSSRENTLLGRAYTNLSFAYADAQQWDESISAAEKALALGVFTAKIHGNLVRAYLATNELDRAAKHLHQALQLEPESSRFRMQAGLIAVKQGKFQIAETQFRAALEKAPDDVLLIANLAKSLVVLGRADEAADLYRQAIKKDSKFGEARRGLIGLLLDRRDLPTAESESIAYRQALPDDSFAFWFLGLIRYLQDDLNGAIAQWQNVSEPLPPRFHFMRGNAFRKLGDTAQAAREFQQEVVISPNNYEAWNNLGGFAESPAEAAAYFSKAIEVAPAYYQARFNLALQHLKLQQPLKAVEQLTTIVDQQPDFAPAKDLLANLRKQLDESNLKP